MIIFRIIGDIIISDELHYQFKYIGLSNIDYSSIYKLDILLSEKVKMKMIERDIDFLTNLNRKNKLNKLVKDGINISDEFIDFYIRNLDKVFLINKHENNW